MLLDDIGLLLQENSVLWGSVGGCVLAILAYAWRRKTPQSKHIKWIDHYLSDQDSSESSIEAEVQAINTALNSAEECNDPQQCSEQMRDIVAASHLKYQTLEEDSGIIMKCSRHTRTFHGAIYTRFVVQYNLFAGAVVSLGSEEQRQALYESQRLGSLGCFAFTELGAGVVSGLKVDTTASYDEARKEFDINSGGTGAKVWIAQGLYAEFAVLLANVMVSGSSHGPHLFFVRIQTRRPDDSLSPVLGVQVEPMEQLHSLPGLDYARLTFRGLAVGKSALLCRYSGIDDAGKYFLNLPKGYRRMSDLLFSRLVTGRVCLSEYSMAYARNLMRTSWGYAKSRRLPTLGKASSGSDKFMSELPLLVSGFRRYGGSLVVVGHFVAETRRKLSECLLSGTMSSAAVEAACVSKFVGTSVSVDTISALRKLVGSFSLTQRSHLGPGASICTGICFAEGDNTIMELKVVVDLLRGKVVFLPLAVLLHCCVSLDLLRLVAAYLKLTLYAALLGSFGLTRGLVLNDGQLLKDIAWARAHILICEAWLASSKRTGRRNEELGLYFETLVRFPTPTQA